MSFSLVFEDSLPAATVFREPYPTFDEALAAFFAEYPKGTTAKDATDPKTTLCWPSLEASQPKRITPVGVVYSRRVEIRSALSLTLPREAFICAMIREIP